MMPASMLASLQRSCLPFGREWILERDVDGVQDSIAVEFRGGDDKAEGGVGSRAH